MKLTIKDCVAVVKYTRKGKKMYTETLIRVGVQDMANKVLSGRFSKEQALKEFSRFPTTFKPVAPFTGEALVGMVRS